MDLAADLAEQPLDRGVDVLVGLEVRIRLLGDVREAGLDLVELRVGEDLCRRESASMLRGRLAVVGEKFGVVDAEKPPHVGVEGTLDPPLPGRHMPILARARAACNSVSSDEMRMKPSAASCGKVSPVPYEANSAA